MRTTSPTEAGAGAAPRLTFRSVDRRRWDDFEALFESKGAPGYCWCMAWRAVGEETRQTDRASRKRFMKSRVDAGVPVGLVGYLSDEPVAWCSIAPRDTYRPLGGPEVKPGLKVWSLACMFVRRDLRGSGLADQLIAAALDHAGKEGADVVEAYPVDPDSPSYRFMGFVAAFERAGFKKIGEAGKRRHVMQRAL
jgi:GNAT superfamily N-acetyltransferase